MSPRPLFFLAVASLMGCAASSKPPAQAPVLTTEQWKAAQERLEQLRATWAPQASTQQVTVRFEDHRFGRDLSGRGVIAYRPPQALRMILLGPGGLTAMDYWSRDNQWRLSIPARDRVMRGQYDREDQSQAKLPVGFLRWWFLRPLEGKLIDYRSDNQSEIYVLRDKESTLRVRSQGKALWLERSHAGNQERLWVDRPGCGLARYEQPQLGLVVQVRCETEGPGVQNEKAFEDPGQK